MPQGLKKDLSSQPQRHLGPLLHPGKLHPYWRGRGSGQWQVNDSEALRGPKYPVALARGFSSFPQALSQPVTHLHPLSPKKGSSKLCHLLSGRGRLVSEVQTRLEPHSALRSPKFFPRFGWIPRGLIFSRLVLALALSSASAAYSAPWGALKKIRTLVSVSFLKKSHCHAHSRGGLLCCVRRQGHTVDCTPNFLPTL